MQTEYTPELILDPNEVAALALLTGQDGYKVIHKIIKHELSKFITAHINTATGNDSAITEGHRIIKTAVQLYDGATNSINTLVSTYTSAKQVDGRPIDVTEGLIDLGPAASTQDDLDGFEENL